MATNFTVGVRFTGNSSDLNAAAKEAVNAEREVGLAGQQAGDQATRGLKPVTNTVEGIGNSVRRTLATLVAGIGVVQTVRGLASMADQYANIGAQLRLASGGTVSFAQAQEQALGVAQRTASSLGTTADLIGKLSTSFRSLGGDARTSFNVAVGLSETISQAVALSGASAAAASAAITQLGQGLASGTLRGDELNSVLEQTPRLAQAIAQGMGITVGQLRALGAQGKITAQQILDALIKQREQVAREYSQLPLTIGRAWSQLQNSVLSYVGTADQANSVSRKVADAISGVARHVDDIARAVVTLGQIVATVYATKMIYAGLAWIANLRAQSAAVDANGIAVKGWAAKTATSFANARASIGLVGIAFNVLGSAIVGWQIGTYLRGQFLEVRLAGIALVDGLLVVWERIKEGASLAFTAVTFVAKGSFNDIRAGAVDMFSTLGGALAKLPNSMAKTIGAAWLGLSAGLRTAKTDASAYAVAAAGIRAETEKNITAIHRTTDEMVDYESAQENAKAATKSNAQANDDLRKQAEELAAQLKQTTAATGDQTQANKAAADAARELARANAEIISGQAALDEQIDQLRDKLAGLSDQQIEYNAGVREAANAYADWVRAGVPVSQAMQDLQRRYDTLNDRLQVKNELDAKNNQETPETVKSYETQTSAAERYYQVISQGAKTAADTIGDYFVRNVRGIKDLWRGLADAAKSIVAQIISTWLQLRVLQPLLANMFPGIGLLGVAGSLAPHTAAATGVGSGISTALGGAGGSGGGLGSYPGFISSIGAAKNAYTWASTGGLWGSAPASAPGMYGPYASGYKGMQTGLGFTGPTGPYGGTLGGFSTIGLAGGALGAMWGLGRGSGGLSTAASTATGAIGGYAAGTAIATTISSGVAAGMAAIPVVGWVALAAMAIDQVSGGKLFGTKYQTAASDATLSLGAGGADASASLYQTKQRALFGGRKTRVVDQAVSPEMLAAANALYDGVEKTMVQGAQKLGVDVPAMIEASLNTHTTYNDKGQVRATEYVVNYLGQTWKEATAEAAAQRIGAEALVATVAKSAGDVAQQIAEQWRGSADTLLDGAQTMLAAQADINRGNSLVALGASATLAQVVKFTQGLQQEGEKLADTYARLAQASAAYTQFVGQFAPQATGFGASLQAINQQMLANIDQANTLAQAAGMQGAAETDLANIHRSAAEQAAAAIAQLSSAAQDLASKLYGATSNTLASVNAQIDKLTAKTQTAAQLAIGDNSPLNDKAKLDIALKGLRSGITSANDVLALGRKLYASSADYTGLYNKVSEILQLPGATGGQSIDSALTDYNKLIGQRDQLQAQADAMGRFTDAKTLAQYVADISTTHGIGFGEAASGLGFSLADLGKDLGLTNVAGYLQTLQQQDLAGTTLTASSSIVDAIRQLGHDLIATITGAPIALPGPGSAVSVTSSTPEQLALLQKLSSQLDQVIKHTGDTAQTNDKMAKSGAGDTLRALAGSSRAAL
ncbi:MAG: tape measure protein [Xanthomonadales bacterium]|nr:tape measure protein [Xanthomonadales bacterium]